MNISVKRAVAACLALYFMLCFGVISALAEENDHQDLRVYYDGLLSGRAYTDGRAAYLSLDEVCRQLGIDAALSLDAESGTLTLTAPDLSLRYETGQDYLLVNDRYLYNPCHLMEVDGRVCLPADVVAKIFTLSCVVSLEEESVFVDCSAAAILSGGEDYYDQFDSKDVYWLSRIIHAEASNQSMAGRIGVGNVVLNRVSSPDYPDSVKGVVFDRKFGVQFEPTTNGSIYREPDELSLIAAYLCLDGANTVANSLYFVAPSAGNDAWFRNHLSYVVRIGGHDFYA